MLEYGTRGVKFSSCFELAGIIMFAAVKPEVL